MFHLNDPLHDFNSEAHAQAGVDSETHIAPDDSALAQAQEKLAYLSADFENYKKIQSFSQQNGYSIRDAARLMLALPYAWTRVDLRIRALLALPVKAYAGEGKPAQGAKDGGDKGTAWIPTQHNKICQLYIPGLFVKGTRPREQLYEKVFSSPSTESLMRS